MSFTEKLQSIRAKIDEDLVAATQELYHLVLMSLSDPELNLDLAKLIVNLQRAPTAEEKQKLREKAIVYCNKVADLDDKQKVQATEKLDYSISIRHRNLEKSDFLTTRDMSFQYKAKRKKGKNIEGFSIAKINIELRLGEITGVTGKNAYGKSTLFKVLHGELKHKSGEINFPFFKNGEPNNIDWPRVKSHIAYIPQRLKPWRGTLEENLRFQAAIKGIRGKDNDIEFDYIVQRLGLGYYLNQNWQELSGGYKLRFELAKALIWKPKLLILDEPLANLDYDAQIIVLKDLRSFVDSYQDPKCVIMSTQHLHEVEAIADRILFLDKGRQAEYCHVSQIGRDRKFNAFEIVTDTNFRELENKLLKHRHVLSLRDNLSLIHI